VPGNRNSKNFMLAKSGMRKIGKQFRKYELPRNLVVHITEKLS